MENLVNYAVQYAKNGFSVLPMVGKRPLIKFADQPPLTADEIRKLWQQHPTANIALRTTNFFVVDIDRNHGVGVDGFQSLKDFNHPDYFRKTLAQETAGGGKQMFYLKRKDLEVNQNIGWLPGVDIKAHVNNYVVVAPSHNHGRHYQWLNRYPIATAKRELVQAINATNADSYSGTEASEFTGNKTATTKLFEQIINGLGFTGGRNNALASFVGGLLYRNVDPEIAYQLAMVANHNTEESLEPSEFDKTFESMMKKELRRRGSGSQ
ncbi:DNA primase [Secundilactobacillus kimchicus]|uniref:bifunctional DNA primase/polymerase n=1 Tax=Secundilactobacillus kimchicus TaxID=528209 RepID=UPI001C03717D|nr:bifunctional DNA primase/polymerase [Secundilactobacillus kimchicus]MBT9670435.1 DNA primase [Secundilactobacillus kimchicus]